MSSEPQPEKKMITLKSNDDEIFEVDEAVALQSETLKQLLEMGCAGIIPLVEVSGVVLSKVLEYCKKHAEPSNDERDIQEWDKEFMEVDNIILYGLMMAANYLHIQSLLDLTCQTVANMIRGKTPAEIRATFNIENDFTVEEEEEIRLENQWAFEE